MSQNVEMVSNIQLKKFGLNVRRYGPQPSISVRSFSAITKNCSVVVEADSGELLTLHIFLDRSVLEVFVNGRCYLASRIYPQRRDSLGLELFARRGEVRVRSLDIWRLASIWNI